MMQKDLASALDISPAMVSRLVKRGMPTDTLERAQKWRRTHLPMARMKGNRIDTVSTSKPMVQSARLAVSRISDDELVARATRLMRLAAAALAAHQLALIESELRDAMRLVPNHRRGDCFLNAEVMDALTQQVAVALRDESDGVSIDAAAVSDTLSVAELDDEMGSFWYQVAAGEIGLSTHA